MCFLQINICTVFFTITITTIIVIILIITITTIMVINNLGVVLMCWVLGVVLMLLLLLELPRARATFCRIVASELLPPEVFRLQRVFQCWIFCLEAYLYFLTPCVLLLNLGT